MMLDDGYKIKQLSFAVQLQVKLTKSIS